MVAILLPISKSYVHLIHLNTKREDLRIAASFAPIALVYPLARKAKTNILMFSLLAGRRKEKRIELDKQDDGY